MAGSFKTKHAEGKADRATKAVQTETLEPRAQAPHVSVFLQSRPQYQGQAWCSIGLESELCTEFTALTPNSILNIPASGFLLILSQLSAVENFPLLRHVLSLFFEKLGHVCNLC